jgi:hypothetical protein
MRKPPANARRKLSAGFVAALKTPPDTRQVFYDTDPPSFGIRCSGTAKSYILYTRLPGYPAPPPLALGVVCIHRVVVTVSPLGSLFSILRHFFSISNLLVG